MSIEYVWSTIVQCIIEIYLFNACKARIRDNLYTKFAQYFLAYTGHRISGQIMLVNTLGIF